MSEAAATVPTVYSGEAMLLSWSETSASGAKIVLQLPDPGALEKFKLLTLARGKQAGQRLGLAVVLVGDDEQAQEVPGAPVQTAGADPLAPDTYDTQEQRDASPRTASAPAPEPERPKGGPIARLAALLCSNAEFREWLKRTHPDEIEPAVAHLIEIGVKASNDEEVAAEVMRRICAVDSRAALDTDVTARSLFERDIRKPWAKHKGFA